MDRNLCHASVWKHVAGMTIFVCKLSLSSAMVAVGVHVLFTANDTMFALESWSVCVCSTLTPGSWEGFGKQCREETSTNLTPVRYERRLTAHVPLKQALPE